MLYKENEADIELVRSHYEKFRNLTDCIREAEQKRSKEENDDDDEDEDADDFKDEDETTSEQEMKDFNKFVENQALKQVQRYNEGKTLMQEDEFLELVKSLNVQQRKIFDDFVERIRDQENSAPFYLYIGGEAGTGKSFLLKLMIEAVNRLPRYSGQALGKPFSLTVAPTGIAACNVNGSTIESALGMQPQKRKSYIGNSASKNSNYRFLYEDLKVIFLDEVSMCGCDKLTSVNYRMQEIMGNSNFMGGVSVVSTGDFGQLPPVGESMIWEKSYLDGRLDMSPNHWNENFVIFYLTEKMRSQDEEFSRISDKVRKGICDPEVLGYMQNHVKPCPNEDDNTKFAEGKLLIVVTTNNDRDRINSEKLQNLLPNEKEYSLSSTDVSTNRKNVPAISKNLPHTQTGQLESKVVIKKGAPVMITSNHREQRYKNNGIVNGSRGYIDSIQVAKDNPDQVEVIWICFNDENTGQLLREDNKHLLSSHKPDNPKAVPIKRQKNQFQLKGSSSSCLREQFPITLCYAITAHKSQGQTLDEVIIDFSSKSCRINSGSFYTAMSRVRLGNNLYLRDFKPEYIHANRSVEKKLEAMKASVPYQFKKVYLDTEISVDPAKELKVGYININSLYEGNSVDFINEDRNLLKLDFLVISDTRLTESDSDEELQKRLCNWNIAGRFDSQDGKKHMGMIILQSIHSDIVTDYKKRKTWFKKAKGSNEVFAQVITLKLLENFEASFTYIRETPTYKELESLTNYMMNSNIIMGDLNLDPNRDEDHKKLMLLTGTTKKRILHEVTTTRINQLDHIIIDPTIVDYFCTSFVNHTTDHKSICLRLLIDGNKLSENFHQNFHFDNEKWTRKPKQFHDREHSNEARISFSSLNNYIELLNTANLKRQVFFSDFYNILFDKGFKNIPSIYKDIKISKLDEVYIVIPNTDKDMIQGFVLWSQGKLEFFQSNSGNELEKYQDGLDLLRRLKKEYMDKLYDSFSMTSPRLQFLVHNIDLSSNDHIDCLVYMMSYLKHKILSREISLSHDAQKEKENILSELKSKKLFPISKISRKRKPSHDEIPPKIPKLSYRTFKNPNMESCWLNSCMQLMLTALDHSQDDFSANASLLMRHFLQFHGKDISQPQNPLVIRDVLLRAEISRIIDGNIIPQNRLFQYAGTTTNSWQQLKSLSENQRIGQQDCADFFVCIEENKQNWMDVYNMFKFETHHFIKCVNCGQEYQSNTPISHTFLWVNPPTQHQTMSQIIEENFQSPQHFTDWRDELGKPKTLT